MKLTVTQGLWTPSYRIFYKSGKKCRKYRKKLRMRFAAPNFIHIERKVSKTRGKISFMHVTEVWSPLSRFLQIP